MGTDRDIQLSDLGVLRRLTLKLLTKIQKILLKSDSKIATNLYYYLAKKHFSVYFSGTKALDAEILNNTHTGYRAAMRHSRLVVNTLYKDSDQVRKRMVRAASRGSFVKNIILNAKL